MANFPAMSIRHPLAIFFLMFLAMSLVWSRALLSILPGFLLLIAITDVQINPFEIKWRLTAREISDSIKGKPYIWVFTVFFLLYLLSIVYAVDLTEWWKLTHIKLHFLMLPLCFALLSPLSRKEYMLIVLCMLITAVWSTIWVQVAYYSNSYLFSQSLGSGGSLPTPINHIRYSVIIALSMLICAAFVIEKWQIKYKWERWAYGITAVYLFYFLHILSVRTGLALAYAGILILVIFYIQKIKRWKQIAIICVLIFAPVIAYKTLPGFELKVRYTLWDLGKFKAGEGEDYSDAERWQSWRAGLVVGNEHPVFGTGTGKFRKELETYYKTELKEDSWTRPHNQWINVFTIFGLFGVLVFSFMIIYPMTFALFWKPPMIPTLYIVQLISMLVEHPLDTTFGTSLFLVLTLVGLSYQYGIRSDSGLEKDGDKS
jgi:O-antigen ligase